jgi:hypothetical protein
MKKSVVLLITLIFISAISGIIYKNLDYTNKIINSSNLDYKNTQNSILIQDTIKNIISLTKKYSDYLPINDLIFKLTDEITINIQNISFYTKDINLNSNNINEIIESFEFLSYLNSIKSKYSITSNKQIEYILRNYSNKEDSYVNQNKDRFSYFELPQDTHFVTALFSIDISGLTSNIEVVFDYQTKKIKDLDIF